ncbi:outer membrane protein [Ereboglobus luteus]|nr:outer membrane beta-barrel protein [Ereboglobus luteus]
MKPYIKYTWSLLFSILVAGIPIFAQTESADDSYATPKTAGANLSLEGGIAVMWGNPGVEGTQTFVGAMAAFGWRINERNKIQIEAGALKANDGGGHNYYTPGSNNTDLDYFAVPLLASYSFYIPLGTQKRWEVRVGPAAGLYMMKVDAGAPHNSGSRHVKSNDTDSTFAYGAGTGVTWHISKHLYLDAGYRYLRTGETDYTLFDRKVKFDAMDTHTLNVSVGWKF